MIAKTPEHEINRAGKRLLREALELLGWVVNDVQEDYGIDSNVQVFDRGAPTGAWCHVQLKSSASSAYSSDTSFISQELLFDHAFHYALEMREPVLVIHADVRLNRVYWYAPQLDIELTKKLDSIQQTCVTVRIPTGQVLPSTAPDLLRALEKIYLLLSNRNLVSSTGTSFAESLKHFSDQEALFRAFQEKNDSLKLLKIRELVQERKMGEARPRAQAILVDPDASIETKFWTQIQLQTIEYSDTLHSGKPQSELPKLLIAHAKALQNLTLKGPKQLKFYALIARKAAELELLVHENSGLFQAFQQHLHICINPSMVLRLYTRRLVLTREIVSKYNRCLRLARYASNYPNRWALGGALTTIVGAISRYLVTLHSEREFETENTFAASALQVSKLAAWISNETGDIEGMAQAIVSALHTARSTDSEAYQWAYRLADNLPDPDVRERTLGVIDRAVKRWKGEPVEGDYQGDTIWQIIQNIADIHGIDLDNDKDPLVEGLKIAARDNSPEAVLKNCEHLLVSLGATGPAARQIKEIFGISTAGSKVVHCTLHDYHVEGRDHGTAYEEFRQRYCESCPDKKPYPTGWRLTREARRQMEEKNRKLMIDLEGTQYGLRLTERD